MAVRLSLPKGALAKLRRANRAFDRLVERVGPFRLEIDRVEGNLSALVRSIVYQQLSGKAAATIYGRFRTSFKTPKFPSASRILSATDTELRAHGLSRQKIAAIRDLCSKVKNGDLLLDELEAKADADIVSDLIRVRGIGRWSAEMFLLFQLGRLDVWPAYDLGVRKALARLYGKRELPPPTQADTMGERFRPYRSVASWYLWRSLDLGDSDW